MPGFVALEFAYIGTQAKEIQQYCATLFLGLLATLLRKLSHSSTTSLIRYFWRLGLFTRQLLLRKQLLSRHLSSILMPQLLLKQKTHWMEEASSSNAFYGFTDLPFMVLVSGLRWSSTGLQSPLIVFLLVWIISIFEKYAYNNAQGKNDFSELASRYPALGKDDNVHAVYKYC